jgi:hypothetical protein
MPKPKSKQKAKRKAVQLQPVEDFNQASFRVMQEVTRRSEQIPNKRFKPLDIFAE